MSFCSPPVSFLLPRQLPLDMPCAHDRRGKACVWRGGEGGVHPPINLIDFLLFSLFLCPEAPRSHHGSGPSSWNQVKGKGLLEATSTLPLSCGLAPGLYCALGTGGCCLLIVQASYQRQTLNTDPLYKAKGCLEPEPEPKSLKVQACSPRVPLVV